MLKINNDKVSIFPPINRRHTTIKAHFTAFHFTFTSLANVLGWPMAEDITDAERTAIAALLALQEPGPTVIGDPTPAPVRVLLQLRSKLLARSSSLARVAESLYQHALLLQAQSSSSKAKTPQRSSNTSGPASINANATPIRHV